MGTDDNRRELGEVLVTKKQVSELLKEKHEQLDNVRSAIVLAAKRMGNIRVDQWLVSSNGYIAIAPKHTGDVLPHWPSSQDVAARVREVFELQERLKELADKEKELSQP